MRWQATLILLLALACVSGDDGDHDAPSKRIVLACDATPAYAFYLPLTVRAWEEVANFSATVLLVGRFSPTPPFRREAPRLFSPGDHRPRPSTTSQSAH